MPLMHRAARVSLVFAALALSAALAGCASTTGEDSPATADASADGGSDGGLSDAGSDATIAGRPAGWTTATHSKDAKPAWDLLFDDTKVQRIDIVITAADYKAMLDDMTTNQGEFGAGGGTSGGGPGGGGPGGGGPGGGGPGGGGPPKELTEPCASKAVGDACTATFNGSTFTSTCQKDPMGGQSVVCAPAGGPGGGGGGGGGGGNPAGVGAPDPVYVPVTIRHEGKEWTWVGMRFKGNSSLKASWSQGSKKLPFRLHFDRNEDQHSEIKDQRFYGFKKMTFSSGWSDDSLIREKLGADLMRAGGVPAARGAFCRIYVDAGEGPVYWGLYTMVEDPSDKLDSAQFGKAGGNFYKPEGQGADWTQFAEAGFVKKTNEDAADFSDVKAAVTALLADRTDAAKWRKGLEAALDVPRFLRFLALNTAMVSWDTYGSIAHNYYLYGDPSDGGRLVWVPWDFNMSLALKLSPMGAVATVMHDEVTDKWPLIRYVLDDPTYRAAYRKELQAALDGALAIDKVQAAMDAAHTLIKPWVVGEKGEKAPYTLLSSSTAFEASLTTGSDALKPHIAARHATVKAALAK